MRFLVPQLSACWNVAFVVLPAAIHFFVNFNSSEFNTLIQANPYYSFAATILLAMGLVFQVPVAIIGATRLGIVTPRQLRKGRRYAVVACAAVAAFLPGDVITLVLETVPLYLLYEVSILLAALFGRAGAVRASAAGLHNLSGCLPLPEAARIQSGLSFRRPRAKGRSPS